jgi:hypothetical protein
VATNKSELKGARLAALPVHPLCACVPLSTRVAVRDRISEPVVLMDDGSILDGRARRDEAVRLGLSCPLIRFNDAVEHPAIFVGRAAAARFPLPYQRALIARRLLACVQSAPPWLDRYDRGFAQRTRHQDGRLELIEACGATLRTYQRIERITDSALQLAVIDGRVTLRDALDLSALSHDVIARVLGLPPDQHASAITKAVADTFAPVRRPHQMPLVELGDSVIRWTLAHELGHYTMAEAEERWPGAPKLDDESDPSTGDEK